MIKSLRQRIAKLEQTRGVEEDAVAFVTRLSEKANRQGWSEAQFDEALDAYLQTVSDDALLSLMSPEDREKAEAASEQLRRENERRTEIS